MKTFKFAVTIYSLVGKEEREIEVVGRTQGAAEKRLRAMMGNRDFVINGVREAK